ncbi:MAG TPA: hypothetical protein PKH33_15665 [bacterium]|jgi:hypothetical protein|nr:hypothetical protein [bacterium]
MKRIIGTLLTIAGLAAAPAPQAHAQECSPSIIHIADFTNNATAGIDKFWGTPGDLGKIAAGIAGSVLMTETGAGISRIPDAETTAAALSASDPDSARSLLKGKPGCFLVTGAVESSLVYTKPRFKVKPGISMGVSSRKRDGDNDWLDYLSENFTLGEFRKKFRIAATERLLLFDRRTNTFVLDETITEWFETSVKEYESLDKDKKFKISGNPAVDAGSPLGRPFVAIAAQFAEKIKQKITQ